MIETTERGASDAQAFRKSSKTENSRVIEKRGNKQGIRRKQPAGIRKSLHFVHVRYFR